MMSLHTALGCTAGQDEAGQGGWTYEYVPGAGDDEESWAKGLSPSLLWQHQQVHCQRTHFHCASPEVTRVLLHCVQALLIWYTEGDGSYTKYEGLEWVTKTWTGYTGAAQELVEAGPDGVHAVVERLIRSSPGAHESNAGAQDNGSHDCMNPLPDGAAQPLHRLPPLGVRGSATGMVCSTGKPPSFFPPGM